MIAAAAILGLVLLQSSSEPAADGSLTSKELPPIVDLLHDVEVHANAAERIRKDYTYHVHEEEQDDDSKGRVKKTEVTDSESLTIDGVRVDRVVARDGKPLNAEEQKKEEDKIDKEVAKDKQRRQELEERGKATDSRGDQVLTVARILELGKFSNSRRVDWNGRSTIVLDYAGDQNAKTANRFEGVFRDLVGTVWIDEQDRTLVQVQGHFLKDFKIGGGLLADVRKDSSFSGKFSKVNDEVWLPAEFEGQGTIRILLVTGFSGRVHFTMSHYQKYRTGATVIPSYRVIPEDGGPPQENPASTPDTSNVPKSSEEHHP